MLYVTVFDVAQKPFEWWWSAFGLMFIAIGMMLIRFGPQILRLRLRAKISVPTT